MCLEKFIITDTDILDPVILQTYLFIVSNKITGFFCPWQCEYGNQITSVAVIKELGYTRYVRLHRRNMETNQGGGDVWSRKNKVWALERVTGWTTIIKFDGLALGNPPSCILHCVIDIGLLFLCYVTFNNSLWWSHYQQTNLIIW